MVLLFKMAPKHCSAGALSSVPECKEAGMCLTEKMRVLDEPCTDMSYIEFSATESVLCI